MLNLNVSGRFAALWKKNAAAKIQQMETAREFWGLIAGFVLLRLLTSFVSIFSGFAFFRVNFAGVIDNPTARIIAAVGLLAVIEVITAAFLFKMFKFAFAYRWAGAGAMFVGVALFFSISFYTSTNGIALYKSDTTDQAATANERATAAADSVRAYYAGQVEILRASIDAITPPRWNTDTDGKPQLTTQQQQAKTDLYNKILSLQAEQRQALHAVEVDAAEVWQGITAAADADGDKYAGYVTAIMILQLIANGVLCFLYSRIYHENNRADEVTAEIKNFANGIAADTDAIIKTQISEQYGNYLDGMQRNLIALRGVQAGNRTGDAQTGNPPRIAANAAAVPVNPSPVPAEDSAATIPADADTKTDTKTDGRQDGHQDGRTDKVIIKGFAPADDDGTPTARATRPPAARYTIPVYTGEDSAAVGCIKTGDTKTARRTDGKTDTKTGNGGTVVNIGDGWKFCALCGKPFQPRHVTQKYCGEPCKFQACANRNGKTYTFYGVKYYPQNQ